MALFSCVVIFHQGIQATPYTILLFIACLHIFVVESTYAVLGGEPFFLIYTVFFFYNFIIQAAVYQHIDSYGLSALVPGVLLAAIIAITIVLIGGVNMHQISESGRSTGSFNNPNQLGYFSVCLLSLIYLFYRQQKISYLIALAGFGISIFLSITSLSKAAMLANFTVVLLAIKPSFSKGSLILWIAGISISLGIIGYLFSQGSFNEFMFIQRLENMAHENDSSIKERGYFAILEGNTLQIIFGLGQQEVFLIVGHEVHSTLGSTLNNYGIIGFFLFLSIFIIWARRLWISYGTVGLICIAAPPVLYGVTHNGIRFTIFWLLFAASLASASNSQKVNRHAQQSTQ